MAAEQGGDKILMQKDEKLTLNTMDVQKTQILGYHDLISMAPFLCFVTLNHQISANLVKFINHKFLLFLLENY